MNNSGHVYLQGQGKVEGVRGRSLWLPTESRAGKQQGHRDDLPDDSGMGMGLKSWCDHQTWSREDLLRGLVWGQLQTEDQYYSWSSRIEGSRGATEDNDWPVICIAVPVAAGYCDLGHRIFHNLHTCSSLEMLLMQLLKISSLNYSKAVLSDHYFAPLKYIEMLKLVIYYFQTLILGRLSNKQKCPP